MPKLRISALMEITPDLYGYLCRRYNMPESDSGTVHTESVDFLYLIRDLLTAHAAEETRTSEVVAQLDRVATSLDALVGIIKNTQQVLPTTKPEQETESVSPAVTRLTSLLNTAKESIVVEPEPVSPIARDTSTPEPESQTPPVPKRIDPVATAARMKKFLGSGER